MRAWIQQIKTDLCLLFLNPYLPVSSAASVNQSIRPGRSDWIYEYRKLIYDDRNLT